MCSKFIVDGLSLPPFLKSVLEFILVLSPSMYYLVPLDCSSARASESV
nr:MAG TPA: hypothetical protein [Bacteriophage sp.]